MQIQQIGYGVKGLYRIASLANKEANMDETARHRKKVIDFWGKYGLEATIEAFSVSRRTLYSWKKRLIAEGGNIASLCNKSRRPNHIRKPNWDYRLSGEIRRLRTIHANLGKDKLFALLIPFCQQFNIKLPSISTIARIIKRSSDQMRICPVRLTSKGKIKSFRKETVTRKPKNVPLAACECLAYDTIIRQRDGIKRYIITAIDPGSSVAFAYAPPNASSIHTAHFHLAITQEFPFLKNVKVLTDNGSEFKGNFSKSLAKLGVTHWRTYPRTPKMNAHCERFNRSIQESFVDFYEDILFSDTDAFNQKLAQWIVFYNTHLPHLSTKPFPKKPTSISNLPITPVQFLINSHPQCNMYWTNTHPCKVVQRPL